MDARRWASEAFAAMERLGVAPTPENYQVWYADASGTHPELSQLLRRLEHGQASCAEERAAEIHDRFFGASDELRLIGVTSRRVEDALGRLVDQVGGMSRGTSHYGQALASFNAGLGPAAAEAEPLGQLRDLVAGILKETARMRRQASRLESQLARSAEEIVGLRENLDHALREAHTDGLTGIANRKKFDLQLQIEAAKAAEQGREMSLLLLDIDHFKAFNDSYGHGYGDQVLKLVARILVKAIKGRDLGARYGGEEFAVILPRTRLEDAVTVADQIRAAVGGQLLVTKDSGRQLGGITLSIGAASYRGGERLARLLARADEALYRAKSAGRNRVVAAPRPQRRHRPAGAMPALA